MTAVSGLVFVILSTVFLDRPIANFVHDSVQPRLHGLLVWLVGKILPITLVSLIGPGLIVTVVGWRPPRLGQALLAASIAALAAGIVCELLKYGFGRSWPETWIDDNPSWIRDAVYGFFPFHGGRAYASFPSGHTTMMTAPMMALWCYLPAGRPIFAGLILVVVIGLVGANYHFLGDTIAGFYLGLAFGVASSRLVHRFLPA